MANDKFATTENGDDFGEDFQIETEKTDSLKGWRIERNSNGFYRYRWSLKDSGGSPITYIMSNGGVGYSRGSKYLPRLNALEGIRKNGKKRKTSK